MALKSLPLPSSKGATEQIPLLRQEVRATPELLRLEVLAGRAIHPTIPLLAVLAIQLPKMLRLATHQTRTFPCLWSRVPILMYLLLCCPCPYRLCPELFHL